MINDMQSKKINDHILKFIDNVGEKKINERIYSHVEVMYKNFFSSFQKSIEKKEELKSYKEFIKKNKMKKKDSIISLMEDADDLFIKIRLMLSDKKTTNSLDEQVKTLKNESKNLISLNTYERWFFWAIEFGEGSHLATHIAKLTHSSSKSSSIDVRGFNFTEKINNKYLITSNAENLDCAYQDNKYSSISQLYKIECDGFHLGDLLKKNPEMILNKIIVNKALFQSACQSFRTMIDSDTKQSHFLSKQIYFPVENNNYHLLLPLTSSSLVQALHLEHRNYFEEEQTQARELKKKGKYSPVILVSYPNKAKLNITGSNHSNASSLNGKRGGKITLFSAMPPHWKAQNLSYRNEENIFNKNLAFQLRAEIKELSVYLDLLKRKELSDSAPVRSNAIMKKIQLIISSLFDLVMLANHHEPQKNWTCESKLPIEMQLLFEPWRDDDSAKAEKLLGKWQNELAQTFGRWLNRQLNKNKKLHLTPKHAALWRNIFSQDLRAFIAVQEVVL